MNGRDPEGLRPPFSQEEKDALKGEIKGRLGGVKKIVRYPGDGFGCFSSCHDMKKQKEELSKPPRKSVGADREIRTQKPEDVSHMGTWLENIVDEIFD
ncbi:MAG: hypothetical protein AB7E32_17530 [Desulfovibrio sp.]